NPGRPAGERSERGEGEHYGTDRELPIGVILLLLGEPIVDRQRQMRFRLERHLRSGEGDDTGESPDPRELLPDGIPGFRNVVELLGDLGPNHRGGRLHQPFEYSVELPPPTEIQVECRDDRILALGLNPRGVVYARVVLRLLFRAGPKDGKAGLVV